MIKYIQFNSCDHVHWENLRHKYYNNSIIIDTYIKSQLDLGIFVPAETFFFRR